MVGAEPSRARPGGDALHADGPTYSDTAVPLARGRTGTWRTPLRPGIRVFEDTRYRSASSSLGAMTTRRLL